MPEWPERWANGNRMDIKPRSVWQYFDLANGPAVMKFRQPAATTMLVERLVILWGRNRPVPSEVDRWQCVFVVEERERLNLPILAMPQMQVPESVVWSFDQEQVVYTPDKIGGQWGLANGVSNSAAGLPGVVLMSQTESEVRLGPNVLNSWELWPGTEPWGYVVLEGLWARQVQ